MWLCQLMLQTTIMAQEGIYQKTDKFRIKAIFKNGFYWLGGYRCVSCWFISSNILASSMVEGICNSSPSTS
jgi:hypothetical protein